MSASPTTITTKCCYCGMFKSEGGWQHRLDLGALLYSHGCCPVCEAQLMADLDSFTEPGLDVHAVRAHHARRPIRPLVAEAAI